MKQPNFVAQFQGAARQGQPSAFTLIELLVVIAIIGVLSSILLPTLARTKEQARGSFCQNNNRQLALAALMYCDDNRGYFPGNRAGYDAETNMNWAADLLDWSTFSDNTNSAELTGTALGPYLAPGPDVFRCPSDTALSGVQRAAGWAFRARSYSLNASIGDAGDITASGVNTNNPSYVQFFKYSSIPEVAQIFLFIDEHPDTISDGYFVNKAYSQEWYRLPASYHNEAANVSFADGHLELHRWQDSSTLAPPEEGGADGVILTNLPSPQLTDYQWVISHMTVKSH